jgi:ubiquinone/menaquinone biosynthesis C-methylase UbiE
MITHNKDHKTVVGFGDEWTRFDQTELCEKELHELFEKYFQIFPWQILSVDAQGFDMGCGSGRWAKLVALRVGKLHCIDPSSAIEVAKRNLNAYKNCVFHQAGVDDQVLPEASMDFGYSLGVLHHVPDTSQGIRDCVRMLKIGAPFLLYLYYALDNRSFAYRALWMVSDLFRRIISRLPHGMRYVVSQFIAIFVYWPISRFAALTEYFGMSSDKVCNMPLSFYRHRSFYTMRTDALDRFGTRLEHRFTRKQVQAMMESAGLKNICFSEDSPYWCAVGTRGK